MLQTYKYTILIVQRRLPHYRVAFFDALKTQLARHSCELRLVHGDPTTEELSKNDSGYLAWASKIPTRYFLDGKICWLPFSRHLKGVDLLIVDQENKLINNLPAQFLPRKYKLALCGHGANLQGNPSSVREWYKRLISRHADWWFAYTDMSLPLLDGIGFPRDKISVFNNAIDTAQLQQFYSQVTVQRGSRLRAKYALQGDHVGVFIGSLYHEKRIDYLLESALAIRSAITDFELLIIGSGPQQNLVEQFCQTHSWCIYLGVLKDQEKADALSLARVMLNPGLVGLGILDSFVCQVPMVTTDCGLHSPEIVYLQHTINGLLTDNSIADYVSAAIEVLRNDGLYGRLKRACYDASKHYTIENMAQKFSEGVLNCLADQKNTELQNLESEPKDLY